MSRPRPSVTWSHPPRVWWPRGELQSEAGVWPRLRGLGSLQPRVPGLRPLELWARPQLVSASLLRRAPAPGQRWCPPEEWLHPLAGRGSVHLWPGIPPGGQWFDRYDSKIILNNPDEKVNISLSFWFSTLDGTAFKIFLINAGLTFRDFFIFCYIQSKCNKSNWK